MEDLAMLLGNSDSEESEDENRNNEMHDEEEKHVNTTAGFDRHLPSTHSYLGNDMEDVHSGRTIHDDESYIDIPLYMLPGIVLIPDQVIPLHLFQPQMVAMMKRVAEPENDKTFGIMTYRNRTDGEMDELDYIGTTAEIFSIKDETDDISGISTLRIKARGRQRFRLIESRRDITGVLRAKVKIMPERILPENLCGARPPSHFKFCCKPMSASDATAALKTKVEKKSIFKKHKVAETAPVAVKIHRINKMTCANYTWWPPWVYKRFDTDILFQEIKKELRSWNDSLNEAKIPQTPTELSFWLAQNLPLDDTIRLRLLSYDSAIQRLRYELVVMKTCTVLQCKYCNAPIANKNDVFSMAVEGPMGAFVNPAGHVHETLTIYNVQNIQLIGRSSTEHSWFPGYSWKIAQCRSCANHMGWKFKATHKNFTPQLFWGMCRSSLVPGMKSGEMNKSLQAYR
ncbi:protein cereblon [Patella vulgata]|uniref:protein cereblon n=1 Tax=Patella vulgata TaxID=6465 RepID=UPI00217FE420|nr:protein cereblon [Patella vulgata]